MNQEEWKKMQKKKMLYANVNEDGVIESYTVPYKQFKSELGKGWFAMYQDALDWLADTKFKNEEYRILMKLLSKLDFHNYIRITQTEIAKELNMNQSAVARAIKGLIDYDVIRKGPKAGNANTYRLNPYMAHKGRSIENTKKEYEHLHRIK